MPKYDPDTSHWAEGDEEEEADAEPVVEVTRHTIAIDDNRDAHGYEWGLEWLFSVEDAVVTGYTKSHYTHGGGAPDYMGTPEWEDVPAVVKARIREEMGLDPTETIPTDLPEFYGDRA